ncbi:MAG: hypothetical protein LBI10_08190 [Deltaproteobacteria bacterium]|jgi:hypothetical protein|nr:hypothetical protein [Deltaproteobacteria bacterium]
MAAYSKNGGLLQKLRLTPKMAAYSKNSGLPLKLAANSLKMEPNCKTWAANALKMAANF